MSNITTSLQAVRLKVPILLIEDDEAQLRVLADILEMRNLRPICCQTGRAALQVCQQQEVNVAILDLRLPDIDGLQLLRQLKRHNPGLKVIINTGYASLESAMRAVNEEAFAYVTKMEDVEELLAHIYRALPAHLVKYGPDAAKVETAVADFFVAGGTLPPTSASYVERPADDELFNCVLAGTFCYILTARQMGKSSLMVRVVRRLKAIGIHAIVVDLTGIGKVTVEEWYVSLLSELQTALNLSVEPETWWQTHAALGPVKCFTSFLRQVLLAEIAEPVAIFIDEIDTTLNLDFSDDFFAAIRSIYNARATDPIYNRLSFILIGVATPTDLIKDRKRTPFNIGQRIELNSFSWIDAQILKQGLQTAYPDQGEAIFARVFYWTKGHPYLTQTLCRSIVDGKDAYWPDERVDELVAKLFLSEEARKETNLQFVQDSVRASPQRRRLLELYRQVYEGKTIQEDERSLTQNRLKLFGLVNAERGVLQVNNPIYGHIFNQGWIRTNTPVDWTRRLAFVSLLLTLFLVGLTILSIYWQGQRGAADRAQVFIDGFETTTSPDVQVTSLAGLFGLPGYEDRARRLFHQELTPAEQLALFDSVNPRAVGDQLIIVIKQLYTDLTNTEQNNLLLRAMTGPLRELDDPVAINLAAEIEQWLEGRAYQALDQPQQAITMYTVAIRLNEHNPGAYFDRGLAYAALETPEQALADFERAVQLDEEIQLPVGQVVMGDAQLYKTLRQDKEAYPTLAAMALMPTMTSTLTSTPPVTATVTVTYIEPSR
jgi:ActR/RegA family two-component response regulator